MTRSAADSSVSSDQDELSSEEKHVQLFCKNMLQGRMFIGTFQEKRYVGNLNAYRDVICVDRTEREFIYDLDVVQRKIRKFTDRWVGITNPDIIGAPAGHCIWVSLKNEVLGSYWYKVRNVKFKPNEISVSLKQLRPVLPDTEVVKCSSKSATQNSDNSQLSNFDMRDFYESAKENVINNCSYFFKNIMTIKNTKDGIVFLFVLAVALFTGAVQLIQYLGEFFLKLMRELSFFIRSSSPIIIACINMVGKSIWGLYMLIAMMWKDRKDPVTVYQMNEPRFPALGYAGDGYSHRRALPAPRYNLNRNGRSSGVVITPLD